VSGPANQRLLFKPVYLALAVLALVALGVAAYSLGVLARGAPELHGTELEQPAAVGDVTLEASGGERVSLAEYGGRYLLVFFGYSNCPDVCPLTMARLGSTYRALGEPEELQVVMVTVDPERDSPKVIDDFAKRFHPDFDGLGGSDELIADAAERFYIGYRHDGQGETIHGSQVLLVDRQSRLWRVYNDENQLYLEADLRMLLSLTTSETTGTTRG
jgi:protein SCO1/2